MMLAAITFLIFSSINSFTGQINESLLASRIDEETKKCRGQHPGTYDSDIVPTMCACRRMTLRSHCCGHYVWVFLGPLTTHMDTINQERSELRGVHVVVAPGQGNKFLSTLSFSVPSPPTVRFARERCSPVGGWDRDKKKVWNPWLRKWAGSGQRHNNPTSMLLTFY